MNVKGVIDVKKNVTTGLSLVLGAALVLSGCATGKDTTAATPAPAKENEPKKPVELKLSYWGDDLVKKAFEDIVAKYREKNPHVSVELILIPSADYQQKLSIMLASSSGPDIAMMNSRMIPQFLDNKQLLDITALKTDKAYNWADLNQSAQKLFEKDGKQYGVIDIVNPTVVFYNKNLFKEKGLKTPLELAKEGKWTMDEFLKAGKAIADPANGLYGISVARNWKNWQDQLVNIILQSGGDLFSEDGKKFLLNSPQGEKALQIYYDMIFKDKIHPRPGDAINIESGKVGMQVMRYSFLRNVRSVKNFEWDIAPFPTGVAGAPIEVGMAGISVLASTKHAAESTALLTFITTEGMKMKSEIHTPARQSILKSPEFLNSGASPSPEGNQLGLIGQLNAKLVPSPNHYNFQKIDSSMLTILEFMYTGKMNVKQALEAMEKEITPLMQVQR